MPSPSDLRDHLQSILGGAYVIERELGGGGMSRVFVARETSLNRQVVIKVLAPELSGGVSLDRFRREIELAAKLQHPNIVTLHTAGEADGLAYYTMPLVEGESLRARLARTGELPVKEAVAILRDVARALAYAHAHHVVHRDIKPDNVLLSGDYAVVTDFGVAKALAAARTNAADDLTTLTAQGTALGTPAYMAPEQVAADPAIDHRADIYAFGAMAYEMLAGAPPFAARTTQALMAAHVSQMPPPVTSRRPVVPVGLATLVMRCLEKRPADRPQQADELVRELETIATPATIAAIPSSPPKNRRMIATGVVTAIAVAAVVFFLLQRRQPGTRLNANIIAVLPIRITATDTTLRVWREGMLDLVEARLTGTVRTASTRSVLAAWRRVGGTPAVDVDDATAFAAMRDLGAGRALVGDLTQIGPTVTLHGSLIDLTSPAHPVSASATGSPAAIASLVDSVVANLLAQDVGVSAKAARQLAATPFDALQDWVDGQASMRRGQFQDAVGHFRRAINEDSTFALGALSLTDALSWTTLDAGIDGERATAIAKANRTQLSQINRSRLEEGVIYDSLGSAAVLAHEDSLIAEAPDAPEVWYDRGETLYHRGAEIGIEDYRARARDDFDHALALDPSYAPALEHLPEIYLGLGDTAAARKTVSRTSDSSDYAPTRRYQFDTDPKQREADVKALALGPIGQSTTAAAQAYCGVHSNEAEINALLRGAESSASSAGDRASVAWTETEVALNRGQPHLASTLAPKLTGWRSGPIWSVVTALFWDGDSAQAAAAYPEVETMAARQDPANQQNRVSALFATAEHDLQANPANATAASAIVALRAITGRAAGLAGRWALLIEAQQSVAQNRPGSRSLVDAADAMMKRAQDGQYITNLGNLIVGRLWDQVHEPQLALAALRRTPCGHGAAFRSTYSRENARIAEEVGNKELLIHELQRYVTMRSHADAGLVKDFESAQKRLAAVTGGK